jgi:hypothetical protein
MKCPYSNCDFEGTKEEVDEHLAEMTARNDASHYFQDDLRF